MRVHKRKSDQDLLFKIILPAETRETGSFRLSIEPERPRILLAEEPFDLVAVGNLDFLADAWRPFEDL